MDGQLASAPPEPLIFEATVKPHRSLSPRGVWLVICAMLAGSLVVTSLMTRLGAWPVAGFNGVDLALAVFLLRLNMRAARAVEVITLSQSLLTVTNTDIHGHSAHVSLPPYWLRAVLCERPGAVPRLLLTARGSETEIARQLGDAAKRDLAAALARALHRARNPRYNNPQLE